MMYYAPPPATAPSECVRVVVDYGAFADSPDGPNTHCTGVPSGATAAEALAKRAGDLHATPPRYQGNFLCALDGYPETGCGIQSGPYWSFWIWVGGRWTYSSFGVDSYSVGDADHDGHPDPIGFRYQPESAPATPRSNPAYPKPTPTTPAPVRTTAPPATTPAATHTSARTPTPTATTPPTTAPPVITTPVAAAEPTTPPGIVPSTDPKPFPFGTAVASLVALLLLGGAGWRFHRTRAP